jgi:iron complex outermembrane receptor protein
VRCTTETPSAFLADGNVRFASTGSTEFLAPYHASRHFSDVLPNLGATWRFDDHNSIYVSYAEGFSAPRTDNLYTVSRGATPTSIDFYNAAPETTQAYDLGYRYQNGSVIGSIALWRTDYHNRIVNSFDQDLGFFVDRNIGDVNLEGVDAQLGFSPMHGLTLYGSASYIRSELQNNTPLGATSFLSTRGKELVETPDWTYSARAEWDITRFLSVGIEGRHVGRRFSTDVNDEVVPEYNIVNLDARLNLDFLGAHSSYLQLNVTNLLDEDYLGSISSTTNAVAIVDTDPVTLGNQGRSASAPTYGVGSPRAVLLTLRTDF